MKIVFDCQIFISQKYGGISRYFCELNSFYKNRNDIECKIVAPVYVNEYLDKYDLNIIGIKQLKIKSRILNKLIRIYSYLFNIVYISIFNPKIIHATYYYPIIVWRKNKTKVILTVYDMIHEIFPQYFNQNDNTTILKKHAILSADHIICISHSTKNDLIRLYNIDLNKISVIYLGYDEELKNKDKFSKLNIRFRYLLYVGQRGGYKNFLKLIEAFSLICNQNDSIHMICFGSTAFEENEIFIIKKLGLENKIRFISGDDNDLGYLYKNAELLIYPSLYEGFGLPLLEAMSCGCPVVCGANSSLIEVVGNAALVVDVSCIYSISEGIIKILNDINYKKYIIDIGYQRVRNFSWDKCAQETLRIYKDIN